MINRIETNRLILRPFKKSDANDMLKNWVSDPDIQNEYGEPTYIGLENVLELINTYTNPESIKSLFRFAIIEKESGENIGQIAFCKIWREIQTAEIEYCIGKRFWGKGYAGEALDALIQYAFNNTSITCLEAYHRAENQKSARVLEKSKMHKTDTIQRFIINNITPEGEICYCINKADYIKNKL